MSRKLTPLQRRVARDHAQEVLNTCQHADTGYIDALDHASDIETAFAECPPHFTAEQRALVHRILLDAHLQSIGRA